IRCEGARIRHWINEVQVLDYTEKDESIATEGKICVQIHSGAPAEAWYKDLQLMEL
ncbi:MAG: DUF1080 domain-containing protein, partial [Saprospiraceae bacterium]|nr:DUF1080 domain-containing protein [Saprospiraceae bacterium]